MAAFVGAGAALGALVGAGAGFGVGKMRTRRRALPAPPTPATAVASPPASPAAAAASPVAATPPVAAVAAPARAPMTPGKRTHELLGVSDLVYLSSTSEFYMTLTRFHDYVSTSDAWETSTFAYVLHALDDILGLEMMLADQRSEQRFMLPTLAQRYRNNMLKAVEGLVDVSYRKHPSTTRRSDMNAVGTELMGMVDEVVQGMHQTAAALPVAV